MVRASGTRVGRFARRRGRSPKRLREARDNARFATEDEFVAFARPDGVAAASLVL